MIKNYYVDIYNIFFNFLLRYFLTRFLGKVNVHILFYCNLKYVRSITIIIVVDIIYFALKRDGYFNHIHDISDPSLHSVNYKMIFKNILC